MSPSLVLQISKKNFAAVVISNSCFEARFVFYLFDSPAFGTLFGEPRARIASASEYEHNYAENQHDAAPPQIHIHDLGGAGVNKETDNHQQQSQDREHQSYR